MSSTHLEPVNVPAVDQAAAILFKLASPMFKRWADGGSDQAYDSWADLRILADHLLKRRELAFRPGELDTLREGITFAHKLAHDYDLTDEPVSVVDCRCAVSDQIRGLVAMLGGAL